MSCKKAIRFLIINLLFASYFLIDCVPALAQPDGKSLYSANCAQCHSIGKGKVIGPDLKDIHKKQPEAWLIKWIKSSSSLIKSGDTYAKKIYEESNKIEMPDQNLSNDEIKAVLAYIKEEGEKGPVLVENNTPSVVGGKEKIAPKSDYTITLAIIAVILLVLIYVFSRVKKGLDTYVRKQQNLSPAPEISVFEYVSSWARQNKKIVALIIIIFIIMMMKQGWDTLMDIGVNQGYQPDQPIAFSHKIHAGDNGINCSYCHFGAEKGKTAGIPPANVCMNCHKYIKEGTLTGKDEIAKIYKALDYDPETQIYGNNPKPIAWVRVHNLPDLAYFNHSQHVKVGGIECQTCHGPVQEMTVAKQFSPLTMGWCIDCHRTTEVKMEDNEYYNNLHAHIKEKYGADAKLTVDKIGGLECAKCHY